MVNLVALWLWPVDTEPKARRMVKVARIFSTVGGPGQGITHGPGATTPTSPRTTFLTGPCPEGQTSSWPQPPVHSTLNHTHFNVRLALCCKQGCRRTKAESRRGDTQDQDWYNLNGGGCPQASWA